MTAVHFTALCIALAIAAITAITIILAVDTANSRARVTRGHIAFRDLPGDEPAEDTCPWCEIRECADPHKCHCDRPCGMSLCQAPEVETVP